ncbi:hypothetical protein CCR75_000778 [Bremia lactucae]|uniref:Chromosome transmission fidelity protein 8 n=1 Tax=Bremia lactucae TaxID=4779 RepID=A0A976NY79_BRELC|nr:hypothetical protein CCR75_000778 [Bremia lactucae]
MIVPIKVDAAAKEWSVLEFQGDLLPSDSANTLSLRGIDVGTLRYGDGGEITLRIGNHILSGKVAKLAKPFAILQKDCGNGDGDVVMTDATMEVATQVKYEVVGIARTRVLFDSRPKPVLD